jgi:2-oxoglutarate ferredoxin oxidoreductase subunit delta
MRKHTLKRLFGGAMEKTGRSVKRTKAAEPKDVSRLKPDRLQVYRSWCKQCGICVAFCPKDALERDPDGFPRWKNPVTCIGCRMCELRCPDFAIEVIINDGRDDAQED